MGVIKLPDGSTQITYADGFTETFDANGNATSYSGPMAGKPTGYSEAELANIARRMELEVAAKKAKEDQDRAMATLQGLQAAPLQNVPTPQGGSTWNYPSGQPTGISGPARPPQAAQAQAPTQPMDKASQKAKDIITLNKLVTSKQMDANMAQQWLDTRYPEETKKATEYQIAKEKQDFIQNYVTQHMTAAKDQPVALDIDQLYKQGLQLYGQIYNGTQAPIGQSVMAAQPSVQPTAQPTVKRQPTPAEARAKLKAMGIPGY